MFSYPKVTDIYTWGRWQRFTTDFLVRREPLSTSESAVAKVVRRWSLDQRVAGSNSGRVAVFAFLGKMLTLHCLSSPGQEYYGYLPG